MIKIKSSAAKCMAVILRNPHIKRSEITGYWLAKESGQTNPVGYNALTMLDQAGFFRKPGMAKDMCEAYLRQSDDYGIDELRVAAVFPEGSQRTDYFKRALYYWECQRGDPLTDSLREVITRWIKEGTRMA